MADPEARVKITHPTVGGVAEMTRRQFDEVYEPKGWVIVKRGDDKFNLIADAEDLQAASAQREELAAAEAAAAPPAAPQRGGPLNMPADPGKVG